MQKPAVETVTAVDNEDDDDEDDDNDNDDDDDDDNDDRDYNDDCQVCCRHASAEIIGSRRVTHFSILYHIFNSYFTYATQTLF